jgi:hypothetical protein
MEPDKWTCCGVATDRYMGRHEQGVADGECTKAEAHADTPDISAIGSMDTCFFLDL